MMYCSNPLYRYLKKNLDLKKRNFLNNEWPDMEPDIGIDKDFVSSLKDENISPTSKEKQLSNQSVTSYG